MNQVAGSEIERLRKSVESAQLAHVDAELELRSAKNQERETRERLEGELSRLKEYLWKINHPCPVVDLV